MPHASRAAGLRFGANSAMAKSEGGVLPTQALERLARAGLRPTRQRVALARRLFTGQDRHVTAKGLHGEVLADDASVSLATVYNTLRQLEEAGELRELVVESGRSFFDTNTTHHHHFYFEESGILVDLPVDSVTLGAMPPPPPGATIARVDIIVRMRSQGPAR